MKKSIIFSAIAVLAFASAYARQLPVYLDESQPIEARVEDALSRMTLDEKIAVLHAQSKFSSRGVPRLGIPDFWTDDGPHGIRPDVLWDEWEQAGQSNDSCVAFPALTCLAASWNPDMGQLYGVSLGEEARYRGKDMILGPGVNIYRTPLGGRNFEYFGEDPYLASQMVVPYIQGLQSCGVSACVKHFALNNDEEYRFQVHTIVDDRALYEIYLPAFKAAVQKAGTWAVMGGYNLYKNQHNCHNQYLLNDILKRDWQFDGVVVSDWGGTHDTEQSITNGLDMEFGTWTDGLKTGASNAYENYYLAQPYKRLIVSGKYTDKELNDKVRRILRLFFRTTMRTDRARGFMCSEAHYDAALKIACDGMVLLQNNNATLPIDPSAGKRILVVGENAIKMMTVGGGSSSLKVQREVLPLDAIRKRFGDANVTYERGYVGDTTGEYNGVTTGQDLRDNRSAKQLIAAACDKARAADVVIFIGGLNKSDYQDCEGHDRKQYDLPYGQGDVIEALAATGTPVVVVNVSGNAVATPWRSHVAAIVQQWFLGSQTGTAIAALLAGDINPSGKLPFSFYERLEDVAAHALNTYPGTWRPDHKIIDEEYKEGIFVGYRWLDLKNIKPAFAFGYGLSYTTFSLKDAKISAKQVAASDPHLSVSVTVTNTGKRAGAEVVQLYITDQQSSLPRPAKELKGFKKVYLQPGESRVVTLDIDKDALSYYDDKQAAWVCEPGKFTAHVGNASNNLTQHLDFTVK